MSAPPPPPPAPIEIRSTAFDVAIGLLTAGLAALVAITIFTVRDALGLRDRSPRVKCVK